MSHQSNITFNTIFKRLRWNIVRGAQALDVGEDDLLAWQEGRRPVPDRILEILRKYEDIYEGRRSSGHHPRPNAEKGPHQTHQDAHDHIKKERLHLMREAYQELASEYAKLCERLPENELTSFGPYAVIGVIPGTPWPEVKAQYYKLSKAHHPDHGGDEEVMKQLSMAYATLRLVYGR